MKVEEYVPEAILILQVASKSRPGKVTHFLTVVYDGSGDVAEVSCTCEAALYGKKCHHVASAADLVGVTP